MSGNGVIGDLHLFEINGPMSNAVQRALQIADIASHHMSVYFRGLDIRMAEQFLEDADIDPVFQHMRGETMAQGVATYFFVDSGKFCGPFHRFLVRPSVR
jgi:hypothetical protein